MEEKKDSIVFTHIFGSCVFSFLLMFQDFEFCHFLLVSRTSLIYSFRVGLLVTHSLSFFFSPGNDLIFSSFLQVIFAWYRILGLTGLSFSIWKMLCHFLWSLRFLMRNTLSFKLLASIDNMYFLSYFFQKFVFFRNLTMMCSGVDFFGFSSLGFYQRLGSLYLCLFLTLGTFQPLSP